MGIKMVRGHKERGLFLSCLNVWVRRVCRAGVGVGWGWGRGGWEHWSRSYKGWVGPRIPGSRIHQLHSKRYLCISCRHCKITFLLPLGSFPTSRIRLETHTYSHALTYTLSHSHSHRHTYTHSTTYSAACFPSSPHHHLTPTS